MAVKRTTHRSTRGKALYAVRMPDGSLEPIQTYERAHGAPGDASGDDLGETPRHPGGQKPRCPKGTLPSA